MEAKECICCNWNCADYSADVGRSTKYYCQQCKKLHKYCNYKLLPSHPPNLSPKVSLY